MILPKLTNDIAGVCIWLIELRSTGYAECLGAHFQSPVNREGQK
jgi:hypothetical protein